MSTKIKALSPIEHDGTLYAAGDTFDCDDSAAAALVAAKAGEYAGSKAQAAEGETTDDTAPPAPARKRKSK